MGALQYAGASSTNATDVATKRTIDTTIKNTAPNQASVVADIQATVGTLATKAYVDQQDSRFAPESEYKTKDSARNVLTSTVNAPNSPTSLPIPTSRFPALGAGYVMGPFGWQSVESATAAGTAVRIATLTTDVIPTGKKFWPVAFGQVLVTSADTGGLPVIEIQSSGGAVLAVGRGRTMFTGAQGIAVMPVAGSDWITSNGGSYTVTMWLSDLNGRTVSARDRAVIAIGGAVFIMLAS